MPKTSPVVYLAVCAFLFFQGRADSQEWTRFRGPNGAGLSDSDGIPTEWRESDFTWRVELPGIGHSQPVLWGEKIFLTSAVGKGVERVLLCLSAEDGKSLWSKKYDSSTFPIHTRSSYASSTPAVDEDRVYVVFATPQSLCVKAVKQDGNEAWGEDLGPFVSQHGNGSSPIVFKDLLILANEQDGESFVAALDKKTGERRWKSARGTKEVAYGTPFVLTPGGGPPELIFSSHAHGISSLDPKTGRLNWEALVFDKRTVSSPIAASGLVLATCGSGGGGNILGAVRPGGKGDVTETHVAYTLKKAVPYVPTPIAKGDLVFLWGDAGVVSCIEAQDGKLLWQERVGGNYSGSPVCVKNRLYSISDEGDVVVLEAGREYKLLARNPLGEASRSTPAVAGGRMYLRTYTHLACVGGKKEKPAR